MDRREITRRSGLRESWVITPSASSSPMTYCSCEWLRVSKGTTAMLGRKSLVAASGAGMRGTAPCAETGVTVQVRTGSGQCFR